MIPFIEAATVVLSGITTGGVVFVMWRVTRVYRGRTYAQYDYKEELKR